MKTCLRLLLLSAAIPAAWGETKHVATLQGPNCGGRTFVLELQEDVEAVGSFTRLRIQTAGMQEFTLNSEDGWVAYDDGIVARLRDASKPEQGRLLPQALTKRFRNLLRSNYLFCASIGRRTLVFVTGFPFGCCLPSLDVIALDSGRAPVAAFYRDEFELRDILDIDKNGEFELVGWPGSSEGLAENEATYNPFEVFTWSPRSGTFAYSEQLSRTYNLKNYCWVDPSDKREYKVILAPKGECKPVIVPKEETSQ